MLIFRLLSYISSIAVTICVITFGYYIFIAIKGIVTKEPISFSNWIAQIKDEVHGFAGNFTMVLLVISLISTLITSTTLHQLVGIHNLKIKPEGTYCFYVEASNFSGKTYTVPAEIRIEKETEDYDDRERTYTYYFIERFFFSNGNEIELDILESVEINKPTYHIDSDGNEWEITLLNKHAYSPLIKETNNADWFGVTILTIEFVPIAFLLFALLWKSKNNDEN